MSNSTKQFQEQLLRQLKGILTLLEKDDSRKQLIDQLKGSLTAWEEWLKKQPNN